MPLTDTAIRNAKPRARAYKLTDGRGLTLLIQPSGAKWWRFRYRFDRTEKMLSLGVYPDVSLREARECCEAARRQLANGVNPSAQRKAENTARLHTFELRWRTSKNDIRRISGARWLNWFEPGAGPRSSRVSSGPRAG